MWNCAEQSTYFLRQNGFPSLMKALDAQISYLSHKYEFITPVHKMLVFSVTGREHVPSRCKKGLYFGQVTGCILLHMKEYGSSHERTQQHHYI